MTVLHFTFAVFSTFILNTSSHPLLQLPHSVSPSLYFSLFQPLRPRYMRVHAGPGVVSLASPENLLLQHQLPQQHARAHWHFPHGTVQFHPGGRDAVEHHIGKRGGGLRRTPTAPRRSDLLAARPVWAPGLLSDRGDEADSIQNGAFVHG